MLELKQSIVDKAINQWQPRLKCVFEPRYTTLDSW